MCAPVSRLQGQKSQRAARFCAVGPDRTGMTVLSIVVVVLDAPAGRLAGGTIRRLGKIRTRLTCPSEGLVDQWLEGVWWARDSDASCTPRAGWARLTFRAALQTWETADGARFASSWGGASVRAKEGDGALRRLGRCVIWAVVASRATTSALGGELVISIVCLGATEPRRARNWPLRLIISSWE